MKKMFKYFKHPWKRKPLYGDGEGEWFEKNETSTSQYIIKNPYSSGGNWYIGQLHFHSSNSDGVGTPAQMKTAYENAGYHFIVTTDHRDKNYPDDTDGLTADPGNGTILWILGEEVGSTTPVEGVSGHIVGIGEDTRTSLPWATIDGQDTIDNIRLNGGIACLAHPSDVTIGNRQWHNKVNLLKRQSLIEIKNGYGDTADIRAGIDCADEFMPIWWVGVDDAHNNTTNVNLWCTVVQTSSAIISESDIITSLDQGNCYVRQTATGPNITSISDNGSKITITMESGNYTVTWKKKGSIIVQTDTGVTTTSSYTITGNEGYVRAEVSDGTNTSYTQPIFLLNATDLSVSATSSAGVAGSLIDSSLDTSCDLGDVTGWFVIDTGSVQQLNGIVIDWYNADTRRFNFYIEESSTGLFAGEETQIARPTYNNTESRTISIFDIESRYIKVTVMELSSGSGNAIIREVSVHKADIPTTNYYLDDTAGDDSYDGLTTATAWKTWGLAKYLIRPRDTLNLINNGNEYSLNLNISGIPSPYGKSWSAPIIIQSYDKANKTKVAQIDPRTIEYVIYQFLQFYQIEGVAFFNWYSMSHQKVLCNYIYQPTNAGISFNNSLDNVIAYNIIESSGNVGININASLTPSSAEIYNNVVYSSTNDGIRITNKTITAIVKNNICYQNTEYGFNCGATATLTDSNNCSYDNTIGDYSGSWNKTGNQDVDPLLTDPTSSIFTLQTSSPLLSTGNDIGLTYDFDNTTVPDNVNPDIGAYYKGA